MHIYAPGPGECNGAKETNKRPEKIDHKITGRMHAYTYICFIKYFQFIALLM